MMQNIYLASLTLHMMHNMEEKDLQPQKYHLLTIVALSFLRAMIDAMRISMIIRSSMVQIILGSNCSSSHLLKMYSTPRHLLGEILHIWSRTASFATIENVVSLGLLHT